ncbi:MAG: hypothetical protein BMS9Abin07_2003 [Acidimicrobiia bacterium]|nr:MAG: hypothetical protein BMS9Abin07_2003 [Acidimicrobiia bacterium]
MRAWFESRPTPVRVIVAVVVGAVLLVGLLFVYDWIGTSVFDTGGRIG